MSRQERERLKVMSGVQEEELTLVEAGELMGVSYRQSKRIWQRYQAEGDAGLIHRLRGKPSARRKPPALRAKVLAFCAEERYADFGPTLMAEQLAKQKLVVDHETLRRWLLATGQRTVRRRKQVHRQWRERKPCFGAMVQLDGSHHDWFEGRGERCVLMVMVDDATNQMRARFFPEETTRASYDVLESWVRHYGLPASLYVDRDSIYRCEAVASIAQQLAEKPPQTQFGRAMEQLGVELILANSPQAKGRVERMNGVLQDRLVKELRLAEVNDLESANRFLDEQYLRQFNRRFARAAASPLDVHRAGPRNLNEILSWEEERVVQGDWTVVCAGKRYQLDRQHEPLSLVRRKVVIRTLRNGREQLLYRGQALKWRSLPAGGVRKPALVPSVKKRGPLKPPTERHPWRRLGMGVGRKFWKEIKAQGRAALLEVGDSGRPPLRSGLPPSPTSSSTNTTTTKGTFSHELTRGHF